MSEDNKLQDKLAMLRDERKNISQKIHQNELILSKQAKSKLEVMSLDVLNKYASLRQHQDYLFEIKKMDYYPTEDFKRAINFKQMTNKEPIRNWQKEFPGLGSYAITFSKMDNPHDASFLYVEIDRYHMKPIEFAANLVLGDMNGIIIAMSMSNMFYNPSKFSKKDLKLILSEESLWPYQHIITDVNEIEDKGIEFQTVDLMDNKYEFICAKTDVFQEYANKFIDRIRNEIYKMRD